VPFKWFYDSEMSVQFFVLSPFICINNENGTLDVFLSL